MAIMLANKKRKAKTVEESPSACMTIDVLSVEAGQDVLNSIKGLNRIEEFRCYGGSLNGGLDRNKVIKYIVLLYSKDTILNERIPIPFAERQMKAHDYAGFDRIKKTGEINQEIEDRLLLLNDDDLFDMVFAFMRFQNYNEWREIITLEHEIEELHKLRMRPIAEFTKVTVSAKEGGGSKKVPVSDKDIMEAQKKKDTLWKGYQERIKELNVLYKTFWGEDESALKKSKSKGKTSIESWAEDNAEL